MNAMTNVISSASVKEEMRARRAAAPCPNAACGPRRPLRGSRKGSEVVELCLVLLPMMALLFLFLDIAWAVFARSTLQNAVRSGARYAVTGTTQAGTGHINSIKSVVQTNSIGILAGQKGLDAIQVRFYSPETFTDISGLPGANGGGNLVEVSVEGFPWLPLAPVMRSGAPLLFTARSMDRMEASPATGPPPL
jgi:hypothetical protein